MSLKKTLVFVGLVIVAIVCIFLFSPRPQKTIQFVKNIIFTVPSDYPRNYSVVEDYDSPKKQKVVQRGIKRNGKEITVLDHDVLRIERDTTLIPGETYKIKVFRVRYVSFAEISALYRVYHGVRLNYRDIYLVWANNIFDVEAENAYFSVVRDRIAGMSKNPYGESYFFSKDPLSVFSSSKFGGYLLIFTKDE